MLINGDCHEKLREIATGSIDAIIADPPYGTTRLAWDKPLDWQAVWAEIRRVRKDTAVAVLFSKQPFTTDLIMSNREEFRREIIWKKSLASRFLDANSRELDIHENILIFSSVVKAATYNPQFSFDAAYTKTKRGKNGALQYSKQRCTTNENGGWRYPKSVIDFGNPNNGSLHHTAKPIDLMRYLVRTYSNPRETVLDFTMGSGSTGVACIIEGREFIGIEQDEAIYTTATERIADAAGEKAGIFREIKGKSFVLPALPLFQNV